MKIQYLGTAAAEGWPALYCNCRCCSEAREIKGKEIRSRSQAIVDDKLLIDFPPDTYHHVLQYGLPLEHIRHMIVTHSHQDHFYPQDLIYRCEGYAKDMDGILQIYGNEHVEAEWMGVCGDSPHLEEVNGIQVDFQRIDPYKTMKIGDYQVTALLATHRKEERCYIYLIEKQGKTILYGNDTGWFPEATWDFIKGSYLDLVSLDCTMQKIKDGKNHMGLEDNREVKERLLKMGCADEKTKFIMNHFSHNGGVMHYELEKIGDEMGFSVAYDGAVFEM